MCVSIITIIFQEICLSSLIRTKLHDFAVPITNSLIGGLSVADAVHTSGTRTEDAFLKVAAIVAAEILECTAVDGNLCMTIERILNFIGISKASSATTAIKLSHYYVRMFRTAVLILHRVERDTCPAHIGVVWSIYFSISLTVSTQSSVYQTSYLASSDYDIHISEHGSLMVACHDDACVVVGILPLCVQTFMFVIPLSVNIHRDGTLDRHIGSAHYAIKFSFGLTTSGTDSGIVSRLEGHGEAFLAVRHGFFHGCYQCFGIERREAVVIVYAAEDLERHGISAIKRAIAWAVSIPLHNNAITHLKAVVLAV